VPRLEFNGLAKWVITLEFVFWVLGHRVDPTKLASFIVGVAQFLTCSYHTCRRGWQPARTTTNGGTSTTL
jgi:hypothetical protein